MQILVYVRLSSADTRSPQLYHISIITTLREKYVVITRKDVVLTRKICRFNEKRSRYYEKICRFNEKRSRYNEKRSRYYEKRSRYNDIIEWKKYYMDGSITSPYISNVLIGIIVLLNGNEATLQANSATELRCECILKHAVCSLGSW